MPIVAQLVDDKALEMVMPEARSRARAFLCRDCLDRRCLANLPWKTFILLTKSYAWEIIAEKAELN